MRNFLTFIFIASLLFSCSSNEAKLMGKWKLNRRESNAGQTLPSNLSDLKDVSFEFYDGDKYTIQGFASANGVENLITKKGVWTILEEDKKESSEEKSVQVQLREERIDGILETKYIIDTLTKNDMLWSDSRNNKLYFSKLSE